MRGGDVFTGVYVLPFSSLRTEKQHSALRFSPVRAVLNEQEAAPQTRHKSKKTRHKSKRCPRDKDALYFLHQHRDRDASEIHFWVLVLTWISL